MKHFPVNFILVFIISVLLAGVCAAQNVPVDTAGLLPAVPVQEEAGGFHQALKTRFIEGNAMFMSFIAISLIVGLAFCLERIIYLNLSQINTKKFLSEIESRLFKEGKTVALDLARDTRGPTASVCYQALLRIDEDIEVIDKSITSYGNVKLGQMEKNLSWITLFIAVAPALGFLGTVLGMIQAFDNIQQYGDLSPTIIAGGMKFALITTVAGLIVAIILQFFYNYILTKIEGITNDMEDDSIAILDMIVKYKQLQ
ncbi:MAG: MotA/TolQ/ExbB proton channel family protein [Dysgonamonadaceae bacterium]|jgi:biopolymer transport protein ExbB|nr:MotA/TolQ/ExbB proton channel family protein [Dysgonamonadaceae bacterium]